MSRSIKLASVAKPQALVLAWFDKAKTLSPADQKLDAALGGVLSAAIARADFTAASGELQTLHVPASVGKGQLARVYVLGLGTAEKFKIESLRSASARLLRALVAAKISDVTIRPLDALSGIATDDQIGRAIGDGLGLACFEFDAFKGTGSKKKTDSDKVGDVVITLDVPAPLRATVAKQLTVADSANRARTLQATPPNIAHPGFMVDFARKTARDAGLKFSVIDAKQAAKLNMGGLLAVGAAGSHPPALIVLEHKPAKLTAAQQKSGTILLVGKAITFDTGGYSIKPAESMDKMKYDKSGGCAVIGAMHAIAKLNLPVHVVGLVPTAENMVSDKAYRPGDILTMHNGVTVEVINTDAEGRLVLGDALSYGIAKYNPKAVIDLATLTGGVVVALGTACAGCFCGDGPFRAKLFDAADATGERLWHLPLWEEHKPLIKGSHGDIVNSGPREAHAIQGAAFLSYFTGPGGAPSTGDATKDPLWAHLDIAGVADTKKDGALFPAGPTGFGVRLLTRLVEDWA
jgi:leucyl aminopeptidase